MKTTTLPTNPTGITYDADGFIRSFVAPPVKEVRIPQAWVLRQRTTPEDYTTPERRSDWSPTCSCELCRG